MSTISGAQAVIRALEREGVDIVFGLPGGAIDSIPIVAITGQVATTSVGNDAFQEAYTTGITMNATKHNYFVTSAEDIPDVIHEAFHIAATGRPGPVLVDLPKDILNALNEWLRTNRRHSTYPATNRPSMDTPVVCRKRST